MRGKLMASTHPGPQKVAAPATKMITKAPRKTALDTRLGLAGPKAFSKRGNWKTIEQREQHIRRDKKVQQVGLKGMGFGIGATALALRAGPGAVSQQLKNIKSGYQFARNVPEARNLKMIRSTAVQNPLGATALGGAAAVAGGGSIYVGGRSAQGYHQHKINERRKARFKKADEMPVHDGTPSGYARYGNMSGIGRRQPDEFSKGIVARDMRTDKSKGGIMIRQNKQGVRQYLARGEGGVTWKDLPSDSPLSKRVRNKDAESDRQRRLGMGIAGAGAAGLLLAGRGGLGAARTTSKLRRTQLKAGQTFESLPKEVQALLRQKGGPKGFAMTNRQAGQLAGGTALGGTAVGLDRYARSERNRRWE